MSTRPLDAVAKDLAQWEIVLEQLKSGTMPPAKAKQHPTTRARQAIIDWIQAIRKLEAKRNAGDPGRVLARRLSNAEYDYTIRDLTGVDLRPTREFPVDPANEAGFDNSAESLTMSPALVKKYLEAARFVADHLVLEAARVCLRPVPDGRRHRSRQVLRAADHRFLQAAADRLRRLFPRGLAVPASCRRSASPGRRWPTSPRTRPGSARKYLATVWSFLTEPAERGGPGRRGAIDVARAAAPRRRRMRRRRGPAANGCGISWSSSASGSRRR